MSSPHSGSRGGHDGLDVEATSPQLRAVTQEFGLLKRSLDRRANERGLVIEPEMYIMGRRVPTAVQDQESKPPAPLERTYLQGQQDPWAPKLHASPSASSAVVDAFEQTNAALDEHEGRWSVGKAQLGQTLSTLDHRSHDRATWVQDRKAEMLAEVSGAGQGKRSNMVQYRSDNSCSERQACLTT